MEQNFEDVDIAKDEIKHELEKRKRKQRALKNHKASQLDRLQRYRARKDVRDGFDKEMAAARLRRQLEEEWQWAKVAFESGQHESGDGPNRGRFHAGGAAIPFSTTDKALWREHEIRWKSIERETPQCVTFQDVPWPPDESDMLASLAAIELPNVEPLVKGAVGHAETLKMEYIAFRRAFKAASLRWHPDKFAHRFQGVLDVKHREKILSRAQLIAQQVNMEWEVFQQSRNMPPQM